MADQLGGPDCGWAAERGWVQGQEFSFSYFVEPAVIHLGMQGESAHIIFQAMKVF